MINRDYYEKIGCPKLNNKINFEGAPNNSTYGSCKINVTIEGETYEIVFHIVDNTTLKHAVLIGADFLNLIDLHSIKGQLVIQKVSEELIHESNSELPEVKS